MDPDTFISGNFYLIRSFIFCYICTVKNTVRECSQFKQDKEQNVNYSILYRNYLFDTRRVIGSSGIQISALELGKSWGIALVLIMKYLFKKPSKIFSLRINAKWLKNNLNN